MQGLSRALEEFHFPNVSIGSGLQNACRPNPYHNSTHAADVTQALLAMLVEDHLFEKFTDLELFALILSAVIHDVGHPGLSNPFLTKTQDEQVLRFSLSCLQYSLFHCVRHSHA